MWTLGGSVDAAIRASGRTAKEIAEALGVNENTISRIRSGLEDNPKLRMLIGIARETNTTPAALLGGAFAISPEDERELLRFRGWIDGKLASIDALGEPNAEIIHAPAPAAMRESRIADRARPRVEHPFGADVHLVLRAIGDSMIDDGILPNDTLYAIAPDATTTSAIGKIIACRIHDAVFAKRLVSEHGRRFLVSANPRYRAIAIDADDLRFDILGVVIGRLGRID